MSSSKHSQAVAWIAANPGCTRSELAAAIGYSRSSVAQLLHELIADGKVDSRPQSSGAPSVGRPSELLYARLPEGYVIAVDFGHTHVGVAIASLDGTEVGKGRDLHAVDNDAAGAIELARVLMDEILADSGIDRSKLIAAVASVPGPLDAGSEIVRSPTILSGWVGLDPAKELSTALDTPVHVFNDANLGAWGEFRYGAARNRGHVLYIKAADGIGAGLILNGIPYSGARGLAGEIGHTQIEPDSALCRCGNTGCLEVVASGSAIRAKLRHTHPDAPHDRPLPSFVDPVSQRVLSDAGKALGTVLAAACNLMSPELVVIGGELGECSAFVDAARDGVNRLAQPSMAAGVEVVAGQLGRTAELRGAIARAIEIGRRQILSSAS
jgi:predicted NBD/HSP70 family sugar kinase